MENCKQRSNKCERRTKYLNPIIISFSLFELKETSSSILKPFAKSEKSILPSLKCALFPKYGNRALFNVFAFIIFMNLLNYGKCANAHNFIDTATGKSDSFDIAKTIVTVTQEQQHQQRKLGINDFDHSAASVVSKTSNRLKRDVPGEEFKITGIRLEYSDHEVEYNENGIPSILGDTEAKIRIFGRGIANSTVVAFTTQKNQYGGACLQPSTKIFYPVDYTSDGTTALYEIKLPKEKNQYFICAKNDPNTEKKDASMTKPLVHQGDSIWTNIHTHENLLPLWASIVIILICLCFSALFSGLNLGLMAIDRTELKILRNTGTAKERNYASRIQPVRDQGNYLLCSILLGNVLVNSTFTILLDGLTSGLVAVICSTLAIVVFGEITPQAICSRHGLAVGAKTIIITKAVMIITAPLSFPVSKILDALLGEEIGNVYNRERLKELVRVTTGINDLDKNEVNIISGALELRKKTVADVMTRIDDVFMLSLESTLDFETVSEIMKSGYSRIPVYDGDKKNIVTLLYIKDLAFVDPDDNTPLKTLCEFYQNPVHFVFEDYTLDVMFNQFKDGTIGHLAFVHRVNNEGDGDPFYETIGLVTLEDVIEELIQAEIIDETDVFVDNRTKIRRDRKKQDFTLFAERRENQTIRISPQLTLATFQYLSTAVDAFKKDVISESILRRLLNQDICHSIKAKGKAKDDPSLFIFTQGKAVDFFVLIVEGRVEVTIGKEGLMFESGPFTYFGTQALVQNVVVDSPTQMKGSMQSLNMDSKIRQTFVPDYSVRAASDVIYLAIKRSLYLTAKKATLLEKTRKSGTFSGEYDDELEKFLHSGADEPHSGSQNLRRMSRRSIISSPTLNDIMHDVISNSASNMEVELQNGEQDEKETSGASTPLLANPENKNVQKEQLEKTEKQ